MQLVPMVGGSFLEGSFDTCLRIDLPSSPPLPSLFPFPEPPFLLVFWNLPCLFWGVARGALQERRLQFQHRNICVKSWQCMSNSWSTSSQPDFVRALGRRRTVRNRPSKILYTELLQSWPTLGQLSSPTPHPMGSCRGLPCSSSLATPKLFFADFWSRAQGSRKF